MEREVLRSDELADNAMVDVMVDGVSIALYRVEGRVFATGNVCTHQHALLTDGFLEGDIVECPLHQGRFCVKTGKAQGAPVFEDLRTYPVRERDGRICLDID